MFGRIDPISAGGERYRTEDCDNVTVFRGHARFVGPRSIDTGTGEVITADQVVIAAGSRPSIPNEVLEGGVRYHTNDDIMRLPELPERLVILGSGFIAAEFAHVFSALGVQVSIVGRSDRLLRHLDKDVSTWFTELAQRKWDVHLGNPMVAARPAGNGIELELADGTVVSGDELLVAVGRIPNGDRLDAALGGVAVDEAGRVIVDEYQRTTAEGVFALGDVSSPYQLKHVREPRDASRPAQPPARRLGFHSTPAPHRSPFVPAAVFTDPQIADVGIPRNRPGRPVSTSPSSCRTTATSRTAGRWRTTRASAR